MTGKNLLDQPETLLPAEPEVQAALAAAARNDIARVVALHPTSSLAWAELADVTHAEGRYLESYAYARVGYHRGLDALRKAGWRGAGPIPWSHEPNRGVLRSLYALRRAASEIGELDEVDRLTTLLNGSDDSAISRIQSLHTSTQLITIVRPEAVASTPADAEAAPVSDAAPDETHDAGSSQSVGGSATRPAVDN